MQQRYSLFQSLSLLGVAVAVVVGVLPSFESDNSGSSPFFALILGFSCIFNAVAFVVKELIFTRYKLWRSREALEGGLSLNIFMMNAHEAIFQLPLTILLIPLNSLFKQTEEGSLSYLHNALACVFGDAEACGPQAVHGEWAGRCLLVYVAFNLAWSLRFA